MSFSLGGILYSLRGKLYNVKDKEMQIFKFQYNIQETYNYKKLTNNMSEEFDNSKNDINILCGFLVKLAKQVGMLFLVAYQSGLLFLTVCVGVEEWYD